MARRDVNLVIRARENASTALKRVNAALDEFRVNQQEVGADSGKTSRALTNLTASLDKVERALGGLDAATVAAQRMQEAAQGLANLQRESAEAATKLSATRTELRSTRRALSGYQNTLANLDAKLVSTRQKMQEAAAAQRANTTAANKAQRELDKLVARQAALPAEIEKTSESLAKARDRWNGLKAAIDSGSNTKTIQREFTSSTNAVSKWEASLTGLKSELSEVRLRIGEAKQAVRSYTAEANRAERDQEKQAAALEKTGAKYDELRNRIARTETAIRGLDAARGAGERVFNQLKADIDNANLSLRDLEIFAREADNSLNLLRGEAVGSLEKQLVDQGLAAQRARQEFVELRDAAASLRRQVDAVGVPTREMARDLALAEDAARIAELGFLAQEDALQRMGAAYRQNGTNLQGLLASQRQFAAVQEQTEAGLRGFTDEALRSASAIRKLHSASGDDGGAARLARDVRIAQQQVAAATREIERQIVDQGVAVNRARSEFRSLRDTAVALGQAVGQVGVPTRQMAEALSRARQAAEEAEFSLLAQEDALEAMARAYAGADKTVDGLRGAQERFNEVNRETTESLRRLQTEGAKTRQSIADLHKEMADDRAAQLAQQVAQANRALSATRGEVEKQLVGQGTRAQQAADRYRVLREESVRLAAEIGRLGVPTRAQSEALAKLTNSLNATEFEMELQREALFDMGRAYREAGTEVKDLQTVLATFGSRQQQLSRDLSEVATDAARAGREISRVHAAAAGGGVRKFSSDMRAAGTEARKTTREVSTLRKAYNELYGGSRQALSINQRLRGEVLSLIAAYGGFYGVIRLLGGVVNAYKEIEAAQARLDVANSGDVRQTADDLDYLRRTADRLGVDLGTLSREYSKFQIAAQNTNLQGARARRIFESITEAARVSRSSTQELQGVFTALVQIVSKGSVQMEELRQQLGDRLPGAIQLMADGLGITTGEMIDLMEQGRITSDALVGFADKVEERFGKGLQSALVSTAAELGRLQNAAFQTQLAFGEAGFLDAFNDLLRDLIALLRSPEFRTFAERMSQAFAVLLDSIGLVIRNFQLFATIVGAAVGLKLTRAISVLAGGFGKLGENVRKAVREQRRLNAATIATNTTMGVQVGLLGRMGRSLRVLAVSIRTLLGTTGLGLILTVLGGFLANWLTSASDANELMSRHVEIMDKVRNAYDRVQGKVEDWRKELEGLTADQVRVQLLDATDEFDKKVEGIRKSLGKLLNLQGPGAADNILAPLISQTAKLLGQLEKGELTTVQFEKRLLELRETLSDENQDAVARFFGPVFDAVAAAKSAEQVRDEIKNVLSAMVDDIETAQKALDELGTSAGEAGGELEPIRDGADDASDALEKLEETVDDLKDSFRALFEDDSRMAEYFERLEDQEAVEDLKRQVIEASAELLKFGKTWQDVLKQIEDVSFAGLLSELITDIATANTLFADMQEIVSELSGNISTLGGALSEAVGGFGNFFGQLMGNFASSDVRAMEDAVNRILYKESAGRADAAADTSTALGLGQFIESTWLRLFKQYFPNEASKYSDQQILNLRLDPELSYQMTTRAVQDYAAALERQGIMVNTTTLYLAHFLGEGKVRSLLTAPTNARFGDVLPREAASNPTFANMTVGEFINAISRSLNSFSAEQLARVQRFNTNPQNTDAPDDIPEWEQRLADQDAYIKGQKFEIRQQKLIAAGLERQAAIEAAIADEREQNPFAGPDYYREVGRLAGELFDQEQEADKREDEREAKAATQVTLDDASHAIRQQELINAGKERQAAIEDAIRAARSENEFITQEEVDLIAARTGALYDLQLAERGETAELIAARDAQDKLNDLLDQRNALEERLLLLQEQGRFAEAAELKTELESLNDVILKTTDNVIAMWRAAGSSPEALTAVVQAQNIKDQFNEAYLQSIDLTDSYRLLTSGLASGFLDFSKRVAEGENALESAGAAFRQFAANFLIQIAEIILQLAIANMLKALLGGTTLGGILGVPVPGVGAGVAHSGAIIGSGSLNRTRIISPLAFSNAPRLHNGGFPGLKPNEVPIIAEKGEEMLDKDDPRNALNGGKAGGPGVDGRRPLNIYNMFDSGDMLQKGLATAAGSEAFLNYVRANRDKVKGVLGT